jgi:hypothetical protein
MLVATAEFFSLFSTFPQETRAVNGVSRFSRKVSPGEPPTSVGQVGNLSCNLGVHLALIVGRGRAAFGSQEFGAAIK